VEHDLAIATHAYYVGELDAGLRSCERLLSASLDNNTESLVKRNRVFYMKTLSEYVPVSYGKVNIEPAFPGWSLFNPSLLHRENGQYLLMVRSSNYQYNNGNYIMPEVDRRVIKTKSILCEIDENLTIKSRALIRDPDYLKNGYGVDGLEDARLFEINGRVHVSATARNVCPYDGNCRIAMSRISDDLTSYEHPEIISKTLVRHEKNWMPILGSKNPKWLYSSGFDGKSSTVESVKGELVYSHHPSPAKITNLFRGGSQLIKINESYYGIIHEVAEFERSRVYSHRFIRTNSEFAITGFSIPFYIKEPRTIEFAAGMMRMNDDIIISFGVMDAEAWVARLSIHDLTRLF